MFIAVNHLSWTRIQDSGIQNYSTLFYFSTSPRIMIWKFCSNSMLITFSMFALFLWFLVWQTYAHRLYLSSSSWICIDGFFRQNLFRAHNEPHEILILFVLISYAFDACHLWRSIQSFWRSKEIQQTLCSYALHHPVELLTQPPWSSPETSEPRNVPASVVS